MEGLEAGGAGGWRLEAGGWRLEAGGWRLEGLKAGGWGCGGWRGWRLVGLEAGAAGGWRGWRLEGRRGLEGLGAAVAWGGGVGTRTEPNRTASRSEPHEPEPFQSMYQETETNLHEPWPCCAFHFSTFKVHSLQHLQQRIPASLRDLQLSLLFLEGLSRGE